MKKGVIGTSLVIILVCFPFKGWLISHTNQQDITATIEKTSPYVLNDVLVKIKESTSTFDISRILESIRSSIVTYKNTVVSVSDFEARPSSCRSFIGDPYLLHVRVPASIGTDKAIAILLENENIEYAERNYIGHIDLLPNEKDYGYFSEQWALNNTGQYGGTQDADIDAPEAWDIATGNSNIVLAVIDSGIKYNHPDLADNMWINPGESSNGKEDDGIDNDGNGLIDDWHGWDFTYGENGRNDPGDGYGHGTLVAGVAGAKGNNGIGITGVCWNVKLMPLKVIDDKGELKTDCLIKAIDYAVEMGAKIINLSMGFSSSSSALFSAITRAMSNGVLIVASAGNEGTNNNTTPHYPSDYDLDNIISVLSTDNTDSLSNFSNYGRYTVDIGAPGGSNSVEGNPANILSTSIGNGLYTLTSGTSLSSPIVSGAVALLQGYRTSINWWETKTIIMKSVDVLSSLSYKCRTSGRLNLYSALNCAVPVLPEAPSSLSGAVVDNGDGTYDIQLTWTDNSNNESGFNIYQKSGNLSSLIGSTSQNVATFRVEEIPAPGTYVFSVRAFNADGDSTQCSGTVKILR